MQSALKLRTTVRAGGRIEVDTPELSEGTEVELIVLPDSAPITTENMPAQGIWDWLQSLPPSNLTPTDWDRIEAEMRQEKEAWGD